MHRYILRPATLPSTRYLYTQSVLLPRIPIPRPIRYYKFCLLKRTQRHLGANPCLFPSRNKIKWERDNREGEKIIKRSQTHAMNKKNIPVVLPETEYKKRTNTLTPTRQDNKPFPPFRPCCARPDIIPNHFYPGARGKRSLTRPSFVLFPS